MEPEQSLFYTRSNGGLLVKLKNELKQTLITLTKIMTPKHPSESILPI
jgi:hypothetical protein